LAALPDTEKLPRYADRRQLAALHTQYFGPLSPRTLEVWPLAWRTVNGRAVASVEEFLAEAQRRFDAAPAVRGGRALGNSANEFAGFADREDRHVVAGSSVE
jgi:hypothetical protein